MSKEAPYGYGPLADHAAQPLPSECCTEIGAEQDNGPEMLGGLILIVGVVMSITGIAFIVHLIAQ